MYGAKGDGVTDDSAAIQAAIDAAGSDTTVYLSNKVYHIDTGIVVKYGYCEFICDGMIEYSGTGTAIKLTAAQRAHIKVDMIYANSGTAIELDGSTGAITSCLIECSCIRHSVNGLHVHTEGSTAGSICYNQFHLKEITSSGIGIQVQADASYINENWYYTGQIRGGCNYGIKLIRTDSNKFFSGSFEGIANTGIALYIEAANGNMFKAFRCAETYGEKSVKFVGACKDNDIELSVLKTQEMDITELADTSGGYNILRSLNTEVGGKRGGHEILVNRRFGFNHRPNYANSYCHVTPDTFLDNIIGSYNGQVLNALEFDSASDGIEYTLGELYSRYGSMARDFPIGIHFDSNGGKIILKDASGAIILDNSDGIYTGHSVSIRWNGFEYYKNKNLWLVQDLSDPYATQSQIPTVPSYSNEVWTFTLENGSTVSKTVVLK